MFRFRKGVKEVPYNRQGYIYFKSLLYKDLPERQRAKIEALCAQAGGPYRAALLEFVTTEQTATAVCMRHHISRSTLERIVRRYYKSWPKGL